MNLRFPLETIGAALGLTAMLFLAVSIACAQHLPADRPNQPASSGTLLENNDRQPGEEELSVQMLKGMDRYLDRRIDTVLDRRETYWQRDFSSAEAYSRSIEPNRERLRTILGVVDERRPVSMERFGEVDGSSGLVGETTRYTVEQVRWPVFDGVYGEGLLLTPKGEIAARMVAIPDADQTPEQIAGLAPGVAEKSQYARRLVESGVQVVVPVLINRSSSFSGSDRMADRGTWENPDPVGAWTNQPHREWIYRQAFQMGRHIIGYELQKVFAAVDWFEEAADRGPIGVVGYGEGGLLSLYAAALDERIEAALVSGYFGPREDLWQEPVYRNVWGLLEQFGDAEIASMIAPRLLVIEYSSVPRVDGPPPAAENQRSAGAPGRLTTPSFGELQREVQRLRGFFPDDGEVHPDLRFVRAADDRTVGPGSKEALTVLFEGLEIGELGAAESPPTDRRTAFDAEDRQGRQVNQLTDHLHEMMRLADRARYEFIDGNRSSPEAWDQSMEKYRTYLWEEVLGRLPEPSIPPNARMWKVFDEETWTGYEVVLDVWPDVTAFGILCVPKDLQPGEQRPVVVTQHGAGSLPRHTVRPEPDGSWGTIYNSFAARLAERGFVTFSPHNPSGSRGGFPFRRLERKANPVQASLFSLIIGQHQQILSWLESLSYVDSDRIGFYGLSWGGRTAIRVPAVLTDYRLSITSGDFNDWVRKVMTVNFRNSYMFSGAFETYEFNLGHTFNHAELAGLIAPRPFMVESGYRDYVAADAWVGYEYAKVRRLYDLLGIPERTALEFFNGEHEIHGVGTFDFLHEHLNWPNP